MADYSTQDLYDNLNYLNDTKALIKQAIIDKEQPISDDDTFRSYADKIRAIETGIKTDDATAVASDILASKTAYVKGEKIEGTMYNRGARILSASATSNVIIPAGYHNGTGYVRKVTNSIDSNIKAENIKKDINILGVTGTLTQGEDLQEQLNNQDRIISELEAELTNKAGSNNIFTSIEKVPINHNGQIELPFGFTSDLEIEMRLSMIEPESGGITLLGNSNETDVNGFTVLAMGQGANRDKRGADIKINNTFSYYPMSRESNETRNNILFRINNHQLVFNSDIKAININDTQSNIVIFNSAAYGPMGGSDFRGELYYITIKKNGEVIRYIHPVKDNKNNYYLYDEITKTKLVSLGNIGGEE